jgi:hypothetical protein
MNYEPILRRHGQGPGSLSSDFGLIFEAFADAFRGLSAEPEFDCRCSKIHYAGWR